MRLKDARMPLVLRDCWPAIRIDRGIENWATHADRIQRGQQLLPSIGLALLIALYLQK